MKINKATINEIKRKLTQVDAMGVPMYTQIGLSKSYGVSQSVVSRIKRGDYDRLK